jgi:hypothetical protein
MAVLPSRELVLELSELSQPLRLVGEKLPDPGLRRIQELAVREK